MPQNFFAVNSQGLSQRGDGAGRVVWARVVRHAVNKANDPARPPVWTEYVRQFAGAEAPLTRWTEDKELSAVMCWEDADALAARLGNGAHAVVISHEEERSALAAGGRPGEARLYPPPARSSRGDSEAERERRIERYQERLAKEHLD